MIIWIQVIIKLLEWKFQRAQADTEEVEVLRQNKRNLLQEKLATMKGKKCELENLPSILQDEKYSGEAGLKEDLTEMKVLLIKTNFF